MIHEPPTFESASRAEYNYKVTVEIVANNGDSVNVAIGGEWEDDGGTPFLTCLAISMGGAMSAVIASGCVLINGDDDDNLKEAFADSLR